MMHSFLVGLIALLAPPNDQHGKANVSPINHRPLPAIAEGQPYSFWVAGHLYGSHGNRTSVYPAASFLANFDRLRTSGADLMVLVGDNFRRPEPVQIEQFQQLMGRLPFPVFNAPGNHDHPESELYQRRFGEETYVRFRVGPSLFLVLDSELDDGRIAGDQLRSLLAWLGEAKKDDEVRHVFLFSHHVVWCVDDPRLAPLQSYINSSKHLQPGWFQAQVYPELEQLSGKKPVYWFSGDIGATWSYSTFYWKDPQRELHYVATGLGDTARDALLRVEVGGDGRVRIIPESLSGQKLLPIDAYGPRYWESYFAERRAEAQRNKDQAAAKSKASTTAGNLVRVSARTMIAVVLIGFVLTWVGFRLTSEGWKRFKTIRLKYYSPSRRRGE